MTALDVGILDRKLEFMRRALVQIESIVKRGESGFLRNQLTQAALERYLERLVEAAVDAASHILRSEFHDSPASYREAFLKLAEHGVIPSKLGEDLAPAAGLRNVIAHQYDEIDPRRVFAGAKKAVRVFPRFLRSIEKYLPPAA